MQNLRVFVLVVCVLTMSILTGCQHSQISETNDVQGDDAKMVSGTYASAKLDAEIPDADVQEIYQAAYDVLFSQLKLRSKKDEDCKCTTNKSDFLTAKINATSADGIELNIRIHYLTDESSNFFVQIAQMSEDPIGLEPYCELIMNRTMERIQEMKAEQAQKSVVQEVDVTSIPTKNKSDQLKFTKRYGLSIQQVDDAVKKASQVLSIPTDSRSNDQFFARGRFRAGGEIFVYSVQAVGDHEVIFDFRKERSGNTETQTYIFNKILGEIQKEFDAVIAETKSSAG